jgi:hypothetical protein
MLAERTMKCNLTVALSATAINALPNAFPEVSDAESPNGREGEMSNMRPA